MIALDGISHSLAERRQKLCARIKLEARWLLLTARPDKPAPCADEYIADEHRAFLRCWPDIRHARVPSHYLISFGDLVADQGSTLAHLIELRRTREAKRKAMQ